MLSAGFARRDVTPPLGVSLKGYYRVRICDGMLDPLEINAVAFDDGNTRAVLLSCDNLGIQQDVCDHIREKIAAATGCSREGVYIACTHTHLAPHIGNRTGTAGAITQQDREYIPWLIQQAVDAAIMAVADLSPATLSYTYADVPGISFIRRYRMKDGSFRTNPGWQNPDIDAPLGTPDERTTALLLHREGKPQIAITHFQTHPDVISGEKVSADWCGFVRRTYEQLVPNSRCIFFTGAQGDTNHIDVRLTKEEGSGYHRSRYMGETIAKALIANLPHAKPMENHKIVCGQKNILVNLNKGRPEELADAIRIERIYRETGDKNLAANCDGKNMTATTIVAKARRIVELMNGPDTKTLYLSAIAVGDAVFMGLPGEPFTDIGRSIKAGSPYAVTLPTCNTNGKEGYFPTDHSEGSYEAACARYTLSTAQQLIDDSLALLKSLK